MGSHQNDGGPYLAALMTRRAFLYRRVSTGRQAEEGHSLAAQQEQLEAYCKARGWEVGGSHQDAGRSGRSRERREGLERALAAACKCGGVLLVKSLDRLTRSIRDAAAIAEELRKSGADLAVLDMSLDTSTAHGEFVFNLIASLAQLESRRIGERIAATHKHLKDKLGYTPIGKQPYGWRIENGERVEIPTEQAAISAALALHASNPLLSQVAISQELTAQGYRSRTGRDISAELVRQILLRHGQLRSIRSPLRA
jgi:site-specific DNA recombinase